MISMTFASLHRREMKEGDLKEGFPWGGGTFYVLSGQIRRKVR